MTTEVQEGSTALVDRDPRGGWLVTFTFPHARLRYVVRLIERRRDDGQLELVAVAAGVEHGDEDSVTAAQPALDALLRGFADRFDAVVKAARANVAMQLNGETVAPGLRTRREMSEEFLRDVVRRHNALREEGLPPSKTLAEQEGVSVATVKHWLRKAREAGIEES